MLVFVTVDSMSISKATIINSGTIIDKQLILAKSLATS